MFSGGSIVVQRATMHSISSGIYSSCIMCTSGCLPTKGEDYSFSKSHMCYHYASIRLVKRWHISY